MLAPERLGAEMRRREFITLLSGAVAAWPRVARAQQPAMPVVGYLDVESPEANAYFVAALRKGLGEIGYVEGQNVSFEFRWAEGRTERLPALVAELVSRQVALIVTGGIPAARAAKAATTTIPIVFLLGVDPVKLDLVASLARPGGNVTGVNFLNSETDAKRMGLLHDLVPQATSIAVLRNPTRADATDQLQDVEETVRALGKQVLVLDASTDSEIEVCFGTLVQQRVDALIVLADAFISSRRDHIVALAARRALPAIYSLREFAVAGGLMSYSASITDAWRQVGIYAGRILKGQKPTDLPVLQSTRFEFVINLNTAKAFGLSFPPGLLAIADEVIE
jgi:putative ABC transport system substrate-binding protein